MILKLRMGILAALGIMLVFSVPLVASTEEEPVEFANRDLELTVRQEIGKATGDIYPSDLEGMTTLRAGNKHIESLIGLSKCKDLNRLTLGLNDISDISPLSELSRLQVLYLSGNDISSNLSPISDLNNLQVLYLSGNNISDITSLSNLTNLQNLNFSCNDIANVEPLSELTNLKYLNLGATDISDLSPLSELYDLQTLKLEENNISDIEPLIKNFKVKNNDTKIGLGKGDTVKIQGNNLDLSEGSDDLQDIQTLMDRGVEVKYYPQKEGDFS